jgi:CNT family concentrative nucleoside transporter
LENARSLFAVVLIMFVCWLFSENKRRFPFWLALGALALQAGLVLLMFAAPGARVALWAVNGAIDGLASATDTGTQFVFGFLGGGEPPFAVTPEGAPAPFIFAFRVLPLILVISALSALLWHWGVLKLVTRGFGFVFEKLMGLGGAMGVAVSTNIFMGMVESPIVIRPYLEKLSRAELFMLMVVGLSTVAGSTMVAYTQILTPVLPNAGGHILVASIISAPAGVLLARIMIPSDREKGEAYDYNVGLKYDGPMDAITTGIRDGTMVAVNVAAFLIVFVAFVGIANNLLALAPPFEGEPLTLQRLFGYAFAPVAYLIGLPWAEAEAGGRILGAKLFLTEFIAFIDLSNVPEGELSERSRMILAYAICGFANVASIGIITGGMTALMPERRADIFPLAWRALLPGFMATLMTASIVAAMPPAMFGGD